MSLSTKYRSASVPLNWSQVRNVYMMAWIPILSLVAAIVIAIIGNNMAEEKAHEDKIAANKARLEQSTMALRHASESFDQGDYAACLATLSDLQPIAQECQDAQFFGNWQSLRKKVIGIVRERYFALSDLPVKTIGIEIQPSVTRLRFGKSEVREVLSHDFSIKLANACDSHVVAVRIKGEIVFDARRMPNEAKAQEVRAEIDTLLNVYVPPHNSVKTSFPLAFSDPVSDFNRFDRFRGAVQVVSVQAITIDPKRAREFAKIREYVKVIGRRELPQADAVAMAYERFLEDTLRWT
jgi:hypothetical protein